jgi:FkbM family methyltransferase
VNRSPLYAGRRVVQTMRSFANGPRVLSDITTARLTGRPRDIRFRVAGLDVMTPNEAGARFPVYEVFTEDSYRLQWFAGGLGPDAAALDIGAHIGSFSLRYSALHPQARVAAYEAIPSTYAYLARNVDRNHLQGRVAAHNVAVSDREGTLRLSDLGAASAHNGMMRLGEAGSTTVEVLCVPLAEAMAAVGAPVELVKLDCEGAEYDIVLGSDPALWAPVRRVVLEYHDMPGHSWAELRDFFADAGLAEAHREPTTDRLGLAWVSRDPLPAP